MASPWAIEGMKSSLVSREVIADSVELTMRGHCYDALVGLAGCDKSLPGMMMAMLRLNVPSIFIYGGSILPGTFKDSRSRFKIFSKRLANIRSETCRPRIWDTLETVACPSAGACGAQFTANTMATVSRGDRLALPYSAGRRRPMNPRPFLCNGGRDGDGSACGQIRPRDIVTRKALENAATLSPRPAARPMPRCISQPSPMNAGSLSIFSTSPKF